MNRLHFTQFATERDLRQAILEAGRLCYASGLMLSNNGNISARLGDDKLVITPSGLCKGRMEMDDLLLIDLDGNVIKADHKRKRKVSSETPMHLEAYRQRPDIRAVIHAHPAHAVALTVADIPFPTDVLPEVLEGLGPVPTTRFAIPSSDDNALAIRDLIREHNAVLIRNHGAITVGRDLDEAMNHFERVESVARSVVLAYAIGKVNRLPAEMMEPLNELRKKMSQG
jgi:L-fuculose-phosphate aldolase